MQTDNPEHPEREDENADQRLEQVGARLPVARLEVGCHGITADAYRASLRLGRGRHRVAEFGAVAGVALRDATTTQRPGTGDWLLVTSMQLIEALASGLGTMRPKASKVISVAPGGVARMAALGAPFAS